MIIFLCLSMLFIFAAYKNLKATFIFYMAFKMIGLQLMCIKYTPPALSMETFLNIYFVFVFWKRGLLKQYFSSFKLFPLKRYFIISLISIGLSSIFSIMPFNSTINTIIMTLLNDYLIVIIFWFYVNTREEICLFIKSCMIVLIVSYIFGIYEFITNTNPFLDIIRGNVSEDLLLGKFYDTGERLGLRRINAFFVSPNNFIYGAFVTMILFVYNKYIKPPFKYSIIFALLSFLLILMANSRTVLISSIIIMSPLLFAFKSKSIKIATCVIILFIISSPFIMQYASNITSVLDSSSSAEIEGSSVMGRMMQFEGSLELMMKSPIIGNGIESITYFMSDKFDWRWIIFGTESIWMKLMIERGILGILSYCFLFVDLITKLKVGKDKTMFIIMLGYLCAHTMSSLPGFSLSYFLIVMLCLYKIKNFNYAYRNNYNPQTY